MAVGDEILASRRLVPTVTVPMVALNEQKASSATLPQVEYRTYVADQPTYRYLTWLVVLAEGYDNGNLTVHGECKFDIAIAGNARIEVGFTLLDLGVDPLLAATVAYQFVDITPPGTTGLLAAWSIPFSNAQAGGIKKARQAYMVVRRQRDDVNDDALGGVLIPADTVLARQAA